MSLPHVGNLLQVCKDYLKRLVSVNGQTYPGQILHIPILVPDAPTGDIDTVMDEKVEVIDCIVRKDATGAGNTMQLKTGAGTAITDAIAAAVDKTITRAGTIDTATNVILSGGTLRLTATRAAGSRACLVTAVVRVVP